jgi:tetratricopeptide (TPR) repeat protein
MAFLDYLQEARNLFFGQKNALKAEESLRPFMDKPENPEEKTAVYELMGLILRQQNRFADAKLLYEAIGDDYQAGYCALLMGDIPEVQAHWTHVLMARQNHWAGALFGMVTHQLRAYPTLFQIRNHLESDIMNLLAAHQYLYLENLLNHVDFMTQLNLESPKFAGRALMHAGSLERAGEFLIKGQKALPNDPEIYFHLGQYSLQLRHHKEAQLMLKQCLMISPAYTPAKELLKQLPEAS